MELKPGMYIRLKRLQDIDTDQAPGVVPHMRGYFGRIFIVDSVEPIHRWVSLRELPEDSDDGVCSWSFHSDWMESVTVTYTEPFTKERHRDIRLIRMRVGGQ